MLNAQNVVTLCTLKSSEKQSHTKLSSTSPQKVPTISVVTWVEEVDAYINVGKNFCKCCQCNKFMHIRIF